MRQCDPTDAAYRMGKVRQRDSARAVPPHAITHPLPLVCARARVRRAYPTRVRPLFPIVDLAAADDPHIAVELSSRRSRRYAAVRGPMPGRSAAGGAELLLGGSGRVRAPHRQESVFKAG